VRSTALNATRNLLPWTDRPRSGPTNPTFSKIGYALNSARSALASFRTAESNPSVNQL
jgi:hypothetical protein